MPRWIHAVCCFFLGIDTEIKSLHITSSLFCLQGKVGREKEKKEGRIMHLLCVRRMLSALYILSYMIPYNSLGKEVPLLSPFYL